MTVAASRATEVFAHLGQRTVWVVGDLMLDEYLTGAVERVSPEAPVPVLRVRDSELRPGGAANVARQVAALGARVVLGGLVGADGAGSELLGLCQRAHIDTQAVVIDPVRRTTRKVRVLSRSQQLVRLDWEDDGALDEAGLTQLLARLAASPAADLIVVSDYAKGVVSPQLIRELARLKKPGCRLIVDPKRPDFGAYSGAQILTPNLAELRLAGARAFDPASLEETAAAAAELAVRHGLEALVVTLGERGMLIVPADAPREYLPAAARAVFDVTGAGDTAIGVLAAALAAGAPLGEAARLANAAAGIAVGEVGTVAVSAQQIGAALGGTASPKILDRPGLAARVATWRLAGKRIVFTNGCFDLLHAGHLELLHAAKRHGDLLVLAINSDESVRRLKGAGRPLVPAADRAAVLAALESVDAVTVFPEDTPLETLRIVRPQVLVKGGDYRLDEVVGRDLVESEGGKVVLVPLASGWSTTNLVARIRSKP